MSENYQARKFHLVINNPSEHSLEKQEVINILDSLHLDYYCLSEEISETGTPHIHIFLYSAISPIRFSTLKRRFGMAHIERAFGSVKSNISYVCKSGKWADTDKAHTSIEGSFYEKGDIPDENSEKAPLMAKVISYINDGMTTAQIIKEYPKLAFHGKDIEALRQHLFAERFAKEYRDVKVTYIFGPTGSGKTSGVYKCHTPTDVCRITQYRGDRILFDAYHQQPVLVLEEFHSQIPLPDLLSILDIYPLMLPARYADRVACYTQVYLISNIPLSQQYPDIQYRDPKTWDAFIRRIDTIREYFPDHTYQDLKVHEGDSTWIK